MENNGKRKERSGDKRMESRRERERKIVIRRGRGVEEWREW